MAVTLYNPHKSSFQSNNSPGRSIYERPFVNVFAYGDEELVYAIGYLTYLAEGSYEDLNPLLMSEVDSDYRRAPRITLDSPMTWRNFQSSWRLG